MRRILPVLLLLGLLVVVVILGGGLYVIDQTVFQGDYYLDGFVFFHFYFSIQYSSGSNNVVADRSASVMIHIFASALVL